MVKDGSVVIGIDVADVRPCVAAALGADGVVDENDWGLFQLPGELRSLVDWVSGRCPLVVAIDAPQGFNKRLLEHWKGHSPTRARACDYELARRKLPLYQVPARDDYPDGLPRRLQWMKIGFDLFSALARRPDFERPVAWAPPGAFGAPAALLEVYPHASFATLLRERQVAHRQNPVALERKDTRAGIRQRVELLRADGLRWGDYYDHDSLDALAAALTARRYLDGRTHKLGRYREGLLWLPVTGEFFEREFPAEPLALLTD